ncbi:tetratricopeptide repeat protein [Hyunsoonleella sp. SJ7]|uniref:Tetratricopeptide repeat protein n=1 Tax=Hyunsoonleella aquatilis TaxID=2762758 RepID=A0A923H782_9FLAO|nr:tetratricopeptide repeat protein [Hyunsoonleella aquatilis]MBC3757045.1 tetratricopeptide repeat protein [Hyunsoonleella aquatilis]
MLVKTEAQTSVLNIADSLYLNGDFTKSITYYKAYDDPSEVFDKIAKAYMAIGNYDKALKHFESAIETNPDDVLTKYEFAKLLSKTKNFETASLLFKELITKHKDNPNYHYELGLVLEQLKDSLAQQSFHRAFALDSTHQKAIYKIAKHHLQKRQYAKVDMLVEKGLETYPNNVELLSLKAQNLFWQQEYRKAIPWFEKLIELGETSEFVYEKLSACHVKHFKYADALKYKLEVLKFNPDDAMTNYTIGAYYLELQDYEKAEDFLSKALLVLGRPLHNEYGKLTTALSYQKKYPEAIKAIKKAIREAPEIEWPHLRLALILEKYYADYNAKIDAFEAFRQKFPESRMATFVDGKIKALKEEQFNRQESENPN